MISIKKYYKGISKNTVRSILRIVVASLPARSPMPRFGKGRRSEALPDSVQEKEIVPLFGFRSLRDLENGTSVVPPSSQSDSFGTMTIFYFRDAYKIFSFLLVGLFFSSTLFSQEVFLSVSGTKANAKETGDNVHQYDFWIKPEADASNATINIFDAGLGGVADIIYGADETKTVYELIPFDALYKYQNKILTPIPQAGPAVMRLIVNSQQQYINRWASFSTLITQKSQNGWILRVSALAGDDVNSFQLAITDSGTTFTPRADWSIIAIDLSICLYRISPTSEMQILPFEPTTGTLSAFSPRGEEEVSVVVRDAFGNSEKFPLKKEFYKNKLPFGMDNSWGVSIFGSQKKINNLVLKGNTSAVLWDLKPTIVRQPQKPQIEVNQFPGSACSNVTLALSEATRKTIGSVTPKWFLNVKNPSLRDRRSDKTSYEKDSADIDFGKTGKYFVTLLVPTRGIYFPKYWTEEIPVTVNTSPKAVITSDKTIAASGEIVTLSAASSVDAERSPLKYTWFVNGEYRSDEQILTLSSLIPTTYEVKLAVNDGATNSSCTESFATENIRINAQPYADVQFRKIFGRTSSVPFSVMNDVDNDNDKLDFTWKGNGITGSTKGRIIQIKHEVAGTFSLSLTASDQTNTSNAAYTITISYRVNAEPLPSFELIKQAAPNDILNLSASAKDGDNSSTVFTWTSTGGHEQKGEKTNISFDSPGDYSITLNADDGEGVENSVQSITKEIHINAPPVPVITAEARSTSAKQKMSAEKSTDADNESLIYSWNFGDGSTANGKDVVHVFQQSGKYVVTLTVDDKQQQTNSIQSTTHEIIINRYPFAEFSIPKTWEPAKPLVVDGTRSKDPDGAIEKYTWYINGKESASGGNASLTFANPGNYAVALKVQDNSGFEDALGMKTISIHINYPPVVKWKMIPEVAEPNIPVTFDATSSSDAETKLLKTVTWNFSDGTTAHGIKINKTFSKSSIITVTATVDDDAKFGNSSQSLQKTILVNSLPIIVTKIFIRTNSRRILLDAAQSYDIDKQALNFEWIMPDGSRVNKATFTWDATAGGVHFITLIANDGQGKKNSITRETIKILVNRPPVAVVDSLIYSCSGQTILFNGSLSYDHDGDAISTKWDFGDGAVSTETNPAHVYKLPGYYNVKLLLDDGFADQPTTATIPIIVEGSPIAYQNVTDTTICVNVPMDFDGTRSTDPNGPIGSYTWDFGDGISSLGLKVSHAYTKAGIYYATLTVVGSGSGRCSKVSQVNSTIRVIEGPTANFLMPERVSIGQMVEFNPSASKPNGTVSSVTWKLGRETTMTTSSLQNIHYVFNKAGTYEVELMIRIQSTTNCNSATFTKKIQVNDPPQFVWNVPVDVALGDQLVLDASKSLDPDGIITTFDWKIDKKNVGSTPIVTLANLSAGNHSVSLTITDNSGTSSQSVSKEMIVRVNSKPNPTFSLPDAIFENELLTLKPEKNIDADRDPLIFTWKVNEGITKVDTVRLNAGRNVITLIAYDERAVRNSTDSVQKEYFVVGKPSLDIDHAQDWIVGTEINANAIFNSGVINFFINGSIQPVWKPTTSGKQQGTIVWTPKGIQLAQSTFNVTVWDSLMFTQKPEQKTITWNPSNPSIVLTAPSVNRPENAKVQFEWIKNKTTIGVGKVLEVPLTKGRNVFTLLALDQEMQGAHVVGIEVVVICE